jgi:phosphoribosylformylglycinamidine synthase
VRAGKFLEEQLDAPSEDEAFAQVDAMCRTLLANPVIEDYRFELSRQAAVAGAPSSR